MLSLKRSLMDLLLNESCEDVDLPSIREIQQYGGNPEYIRTGKNRMLKGSISDPRNKALMKMFNLIGIGERVGSGKRV